ncbi:cytoplasmic protein NCK2-like isoform X3 [Lineus longissimus]|uniref:cytoplasmic protein NCK2-like isoform X3 n=1 Tax=Lineus longissimus TaxID=88925 RepID=UPI002B4E75CD
MCSCFGRLKDMKTKMSEEVVIAKYDYTAQDKRELNIKKNEKLFLLDDSKHWWKVLNYKSQAGFVPSNYVKKVKPGLFSSLRNTLGRRKNSHDKGAAAASIKNGGAVCDRTDSTDIEILPCKNVSAVVRYAYEAQKLDEMSLVKGEIITVIEKSSDGWWRGKKKTSEEGGWFPSNYVIDCSEEPNSNTLPSGLIPADPTPLRENGVATESVEIVLTMYPFTSNTAEELSFDCNERLEVIEKPLSDPDWWRARNAQGAIGLVPRNYVQVVDSDFENTLSMSQSHSNSSISGGNLSTSNSLGLSAMVAGSATNVRSQFDISGPLMDKEWYYGKISRQECDDMMNEFAENGDFLIRDSESKAGNFTVTLKAEHKNKHFRVILTDDMYCIGQQTFDSLDDLVDHYMKHPIYKHEVEKLYLIKPFVHPEDRMSKL